MQLQIHHIAYHRNGISGAPFHAVLFDDKAAGRMVGLVFEQPHHVAVLQVALLTAGDIAFRSNSWRGDRYEPFLRQAIHAAQNQEA